MNPRPRYHIETEVPELVGESVRYLVIVIVSAVVFACVVKAEKLNFAEITGELDGGDVQGVHRQGFPGICGKKGTD